MQYRLYRRVVLFQKRMEKIMPFIKDIAIEFNRKVIILLGGVLKENKKAIKFYERNGFVKVGEFINTDNTLCFDMLMNIKT